MILRRQDRFSTFIASLAVATTAAFVACATNPAASDNASQGTGPNIGDSCANPGHEGCPCSSSGATAQCGKIVQQSGNYVTCQIGTSTCNGSTWGACAGDHVVSQSLPGNSLTTQGLHTLGVTGPCNDACDPYCTQTANDPTDVDAAGLENTDAGISIIGTVVTPDGSAPTCQGLQCNVTTTCSGGGSTTLTGHVYDPAGIRPLYNAYVYIPVDPSAPLPAFGSGASCDACAGSGSLSAVAVAQTDASGAFTMTGVPDGVAFPLVVQVGKWRREIVMPAVAACSTTPVDPANSRLPRNRTDGNGGKADMPHIAIATGSADPFECLLLKIGIDPAEIDIPSKNPAIDYYVANGRDHYPGGGTAPPLSALAGSTATLNTYDAVILPCEGYEDDANNGYVPNMTSYADGGGKLFATHFGYAWLATPNSGTAVNSSEFYGTASWVQPFAGYDIYDPMTGYIDQSFPKGVAYAQWLQNVGASSALGQISIVNARHDATGVLAGSQQWMHGWSTGADPSGVGSASTNPDDMMMHMTFNTPVGAAKECGRVVFSDFHVSASDITGDGSCTTDSDCGFGATCSGGAVTGNCDQEPCKIDSDCGDSNLACVGATPGSCVARGCTKNSNCSSNSCVGGKCQCVTSADCGGAACNAGVCDPTSCLKSPDCGSGNIRKCSGAKNGACSKACTVSADCGGTDRCASNSCYTTCNNDGDCPGSTTSCNGAAPNTCTTISDSFPYSCVQSPMSAQEEALEFMFFDLAACVSDDKFAPPPPTPPVTYYYPATFTEQFTATCPAGQTMKWREVDWQATIPSGASIDFSAQTSSDFVTLDPATPLLVAHATTNTSLPNFDVSYIDLADKGGGGAFATATPPVPSQADLVLTIRLNPTPDQLSTPNLAAWKVRYDCVDAQ